MPDASHHDASDLSTADNSQSTHHVSILSTVGPGPVCPYKPKPCRLVRRNVTLSSEAHGSIPPHNNYSWKCSLIRM
jgi:hypothetical protein